MRGNPSSSLQTPPLTLATKEPGWMRNLCWFNFPRDFAALGSACASWEGWQWEKGWTGRGGEGSNEAEV